MRLSRTLRAGAGLLCEPLVAIHGLHAYDYTCWLPSIEELEGTCQIWKPLACTIFATKFLTEKLFSCNDVFYRSKRNSRPCFQQNHRFRKEDSSTRSANTAADKKAVFVIPLSIPVSAVLRHISCSCAGTTLSMRCVTRGFRHCEEPE